MFSKASLDSFWERGMKEAFFFALLFKGSVMAPIQAAVAPSSLETDSLLLGRSGINLLARVIQTRVEFVSSLD